MKRIKHNDLTHYFLRPHSELPQAYLASCEEFFRELGEKRNKFQASSSNATRHNLFTEIEAASRKRQAASAKQQAPAGLNSDTIRKQFKHN
jgi:hypothetical protein